MGNDNETALPDVVLLDVQRFGASDDMESALLLCDAWQAGQRGPLTVQTRMVTVPHLVAALLAAQAVATELAAASSAAPSTPRPLQAAGATAAAAPTSPSATGGAVVSFLLQTAWLHVQLTRQDALTLQAHLARALGSG